MIEINKIWQENCLETMARVPPNFFDYTITSPPYNLGKSFRGELYKNYKDDMLFTDYYKWNILIIDELLRVVKNDIFYNIQMLSKNKMAVLRLFGHYYNKIKDIIIWVKNNPVPASTKGVMTTKFEFIFIFNKKCGDNRVFDNTDINGNFHNVITGNVASKDYFTKDHFAIFPEYLPRTIIQRWGKEGDIWYDPFMGSGTTAIACIKEKRQWVGSEIESKYVDKANLRIKNEYGQGTIQY